MTITFLSTKNRLFPLLLQETVNQVGLLFFCTEVFSKYFLSPLEKLAALFVARLSCFTCEVLFYKLAVYDRIVRVENNFFNVGRTYDY